MKSHIKLMILTVFSLIVGCEGFLDEKPNKSILVPETIEEFEAIIDNYDRLNTSPVLSFMFADDYWVANTTWDNFAPWQQNAYKWSDDPYLPNESTLDFSVMYRKIFSANVILDKINQEPDWDQSRMEHLKARALFWRAHGYFELAALFLPIPEKAGDSQEIRIPFRTTAEFGVQKDMEEASAVFDLILEDLKGALPNLPEATTYPTQPSYYSAHALLARINLYLGNYEQAIVHANKVLEGNFELLDYNDLDLGVTFPMSLFNSETILFTNMISQSTVSRNNVAFVDSTLVKSYQDNDLRAALIFENNTGTSSFKGNYTGRQDVFTGIALDEIYLILAESNFRLGNSDIAKDYLKELMENRYQDLDILDDWNLELDFILEERRKSLLFRGQRWMDLKRLSVHDSYITTLKREVNGEMVSFETKPENFIAKVPQRQYDLQ
ncbi:tetratricopeptide (TPR) repeat protein [Algoriphagus iocasae]|uniref:Tetratricopeptide (TPR) repeat protein n=1 Tax=Algoriphagus iocasae TaxID=1836499 RepID=A0A841MLE9_9BACT|nr:RagB/SusD family nutrient uptake outer membrane protein [Algoriphagus iocasae]MBB6328270.1 tetratricopeptide (TPR) repeat protein [Algoriphagus iocasae]